VIHYLLRETCAPYMAMLQEWIMKGVINDPYQEFLVMENRDVSKNDISTDFNDAYWYTSATHTTHPPPPTHHGLRPTPKLG
jgi:hypothetical protein